MNAQTGNHYSMCPGTVSGEFDSSIHKFVNSNFTETMQPLIRAIQIIREFNKINKILLTVSPVPLTATASGQHVLAATSRSKSILRAVAAECVERYPFVDYFPSYEIITGIPFRSMWFEPNLRTVAPQGVQFVMDNFFADHVRRFGQLRGPVSVSVRHVENDDLVCEEELLSAFS